VYNTQWIKTMNSMMKAKSTLKKYKICLVVTTWLLIFGARVRRQAGTKGSSMHAQPSVFCLFHKRPQHWIYACTPYTENVFKIGITWPGCSSVSPVPTMHCQLQLHTVFGVQRVIYQIHTIYHYFLPLKTHFLFTSNKYPQKSSCILHLKVKGY